MIHEVAGAVGHLHERHPRRDARPGHLCRHRHTLSVFEVRLLAEELEQLGRVIEVGLRVLGEFSPRQRRRVSKQYIEVEEQVLTHLGDRFDVAAECEITAECNPSDLSPERLTAYRATGVNRLSLGVQSFRDLELDLIGRRQSAAG